MIRRASPKTAKESPKLKGFDDFELRLGDIMRGERATLGKSLLDVQRDLKIKATYISAIENSDPSAFDTPGFIAGYVRSYARYLGMNPDEVYAEFCKESGFQSPDGMSARMSPDAVSAARKPSKSKTGDPLGDPNPKFLPMAEPMLSRVEPAAIGSVLVMLGLIGGIGFGGWTVLQEIQRVDVAVEDDTPVSAIALDPLSAATSGEIHTAQADSSDALNRLYRPQALDVPVLEPRDGPIASVDPRSVGVFVAPEPAYPPAEVIAQNVFAALEAAKETSVQVVEEHAPTVAIVAVRPAWVRVSAADGSILLEKVLDAGENFELPATETPPVLRVGESGAVYFAVNGEHYGPAGPVGVVTSNIALNADTLRDEYTLADLTRDRDLARMVAEAEINTVSDQSE